MSSFVLEESNRCLHCKNPQCTSGCPVHYDIPKFLSLAKQGLYAEAVATVGHLFGEICGYVCPRDKQCKGHCILNVRKSGVDVGMVERRVFAQSFPVLNVTDNVLSHLKVAVVGGGVSGVTFAQQCYAHGATVTIFERNRLLHTLFSVPNFRLPKEALCRVVSAVENSGIIVKKLDVDYADVEKMRKDFDVVYLATGVTVPNKMNVPGEEHAISADSFLRGEPFGEAIVVGGGNTAMDCARKNVRAGFKTVVAYRRRREDMPAFDAEISEAEKEGVEFCFNLAPVSVERNGKVQVTFAKTVSEGRGKLTVTEETCNLQCDCLVVATGNGYDSAVYPAEWRIAVQSGNNVCDNVYAGGDAVGKSLVAEAVSDALVAFETVLEKYKR